MERVLIQELASALASKYGLKEKEARQFIYAVFEMIREGIEIDRQVKVKGLGTFKIVSVDSRESINVNTGERVVIESHEKVSFTADSIMKELVNKPFSLFETVMIDDDIDLTELETAATQLAAPIIAEEQTAVQRAEEEPVEVLEEKNLPDADVVNNEDEASVEEDSSLTEEPNTTHEEVDVIDEAAPDNAETDESSDTESEESAESEESYVGDEVADDEDDEEETRSYRWLLWLLLGLLLAGGLAYGGWYCYKHNYFESVPFASVAEVETNDSLQNEAKVLPAETADSLVVGEDSLVEKTDSLAKPTAQKDTVAAMKAPEPAEQVEDYMVYNNKDVRLRLGAYYIMGLDRVVKAREGDRTKSLARRYLGKGMECYIEVYNNLDGQTVLEAGQEVKLPKIKLKKIVNKQKKKNNKQNNN